jgi:hypothetical protein
VCVMCVCVCVVCVYVVCVGEGRGVGVGVVITEKERREGIQNDGIDARRRRRMYAGLKITCDETHQPTRWHTALPPPQKEKINTHRRSGGRECPEK